MFVIGQTPEQVTLTTALAGRVEGRSRLARLGIGVHITAPKIDPGFSNNITLEMFNIGPSTIRLQAGMVFVLCWWNA
jgi:dCTP deaminase